MFGIKAGFDITIANPPYLDSENMVKNMNAIRKEYAALFSSARGNWDIFIIFIEKGLLSLNLNGILSFIIPNKLISADYSQAIRSIISKINLIEIRDYSNVNVFKEAAVYPIVIIIDNSITKQPVKVTQMLDTINVLESHLIDSTIFYKDINWSQHIRCDKNSIDLISKLLKHEPLANHSFISGAATVSEAYEIKKLLLEYEDIDKRISYKKFINTGTIDKYTPLWGVYNTQYIKESYSRRSFMRVI